MTKQKKKSKSVRSIRRELDRVYEGVKARPSEMQHKYGKNIHLLADTAMLTILNRFGSDQTFQPEANRLLKVMYEQLLFSALNCEAPRAVVTEPTRMIQYHDHARYHGDIFDEETEFVCADLMRAGIYPSHVCYDRLHDFFPPENLRQDHIVAARMTDEREQVVGVQISGSKIGGTIKNKILIIPDPMGATGGTVVHILKKYNEEFGGPPRDVWLLHCIVTPEYIRRVSRAFPEAKVFAIRCDRGMSPANVMSTKFGQHPDKERGLNERQYIVPGGGGIGEILNNSFI